MESDLLDKYWTTQICKIINKIKNFISGKNYLITFKKLSLPTLFAKRLSINLLRMIVAFLIKLFLKKFAVKPFPKKVVITPFPGF